MTVLTPDAQPIAGVSHVFDDGDDIVFGRVIVVTETLVGVRRFQPRGREDSALLSGSRWKLRASLTMAPPA